MPGPLITRQDIANSAVTQQPRKFDKIGGKTRAARVFFYFPTPNVPVAMPHALGRTPGSWKLLSSSRGLLTIETTTNGTTTLTSSALFGKVRIGDVISGTGITDGTYVAAKATDSSLTMSAAAGDSTTNDRSFTGPPGNVYSPIAQDTSGTSTFSGDQFNLTGNYIVLACETGFTWAEVEVG